MNKSSKIGLTAAALMACATAASSTAGGTPDFTILTVDNNGNLTLTGVTMSNGSSGGEDGAGGAILNDGSLTANQDAFTGNYASAYGGAVDQPAVRPGAASRAQRAAGDKPLRVQDGAPALPGAIVRHGLRPERRHPRPDGPGPGA